MEKKILITIIAAIMSFGLIAQTTYTVSSGSTSSQIQSLIDGSTAGDILEFEAGTYTLDACINVNKGITLIGASSHSSIIDGSTSVRCFELTNDAILDGLAIQNARNNSGFGGAVNIPNGGTVRNCILRFNEARDGGGVAIGSAGLVENCWILGNTAIYGGGVRILSATTNAIVRNCHIELNSSTSNYGGGIHINSGSGAQVISCTIVDNTSAGSSGGITNNTASIIKNTIIYDNTNNSGFKDYYNKNDYGYFIHCCSPDFPANDGLHYIDNITDRPKFVHEETFTYYADYHLYEGSPCIDAGENEDWMNIAFDLDGITARIFNGTVDIGCYEYFLLPTDSDNDGVIDTEDDCPETPTGETVDEFGCSDSQKDTDNDGVMDSEDNCPNTPSGETVNIYGCSITDTDGDGIPDVDDDFPEDPDLAFVNKFPASGFGSLGFEDLWPGKGDYDFNDVVVDYKFIYYTNGENKVVYVTAKFIFKASGAYLHNGFGFSLTKGKASLRTGLTVTGFDIQESYINLRANGTEKNQNRATIIVCDNVFNLLKHPGSGTGVNTEQWAPFVPFKSVTLTMTPTPDTYTWEDLGLNDADWNPFIIVDMERGREVHLKDKAPTALADPSLFGTVEDDSNPGEGRYYTTLKNLPWAISVPNFDWPRERIEINWAYTYFIKWAESQGTTHTNWYKDKPGFRTEENIYQLPNP